MPSPLRRSRPASKSRSARSFRGQVSRSARANVRAQPMRGGWRM